MTHLTSDGRLPSELCSVCRHEDHAPPHCTCSPASLLARGDIDQEDAYRMIGVQPPDADGFTLPLGARRQRGFWLRAHNRRKLRTYRRRNRRACPHAEVTPWYMLDMGARQARWCRACGYTEER